MISLPRRHSRIRKTSRKKAAYLRSTRSERDAVRERAGGRCQIQSPVCAPWTGMGFGHIKSAAQGGGYDRANGLYACNACNRWCSENPKEAAERGFIVSKKHPQEGSAT